MPLVAPPSRRSPRLSPLQRALGCVPLALVAGGLLGGCVQSTPTYTHLPVPGTVSPRPAGAMIPAPDPAPATPAIATQGPTEPTGSGTSTPGVGAGACGRLQALRAYRASLLDLIAAIEAGGVTPAERTDLMQAMARLHGAEADMATAAADVAGARYRLQALTGGALAAEDLPPCR